MRADAEATKLQGQKASDIIVSRSAYYNTLRQKTIKCLSTKWDESHLERKQPTMENRYDRH